MKVLFIGNSHTYFNDMPQLFAQIVRASGEAADVTMLTHGGKGWDFHVKEPEVRFNIRFGGYDAVVLQHSAHPMGDPDVMAQCGATLIDWVKEAGARPVLYMTWTTKADGESAQDGMSAAYEHIAQTNACEVAPVGRVWWAFHRRMPESELYAPDGKHASEEGSRLAAYTIAHTILRRGVKPMSDAPEDAVMLEEAERLIGHTTRKEAEG